MAAIVCAASAVRSVVVVSNSKPSNEYVLPFIVIVVAVFVIVKCPFVVPSSLAAVCVAVSSYVPIVGFLYMSM